MDAPILWTPPAARKAASAMWKFAETTADRHQCAPDDYAGLLRWSIADPDAFYGAVWDFAGVIGEKGAPAFVPGADLRQARFFPNARLNYAENLLREPDARVAIIAHRDDGTRRSLTRKELYDLVSRIVQALRAEGVGPGDRIAAIVTNDIESIAFYLASSAIGAVWSSCSPDFGPAGAADRLAQIDPVILIAVPGYGYAGKSFDISASINAVAQTQSVRRIVILGDVADATSFAKPAQSLDAWLEPFPPRPIDFHRGSFDAPMVILFSSGTTGKPKCIAHAAGGLLLQHLKEHLLQCDLKPNDRLFYFSTCGWMMWNWHISGLALGATLITFDGNPFFPEASRLLDLIDNEDIAIFGTSAKYIDACAKAELKPRKTHSLASLKTVLSTGSPLLPQSFDYIYRDWKPDLHLASISGGTDICACFVGGNPVSPVRRGEIQGAMLGMDLDALDENGQPVAGEPGEFICRNAHPSMPVFFWDDADGSRYRDAYFSRFPDVWAQGDFIEKRPFGGFVIHGRSDATLNPGGVRIGTAEIYRQVETIDAIQEAVVVGQNWEGDQRVLLFLRMKPGFDLDADLEKLIRTRIRTGATPRHVPAMILSVPDIPRTRSGKISEIAVRDAINGRMIKNTTALANAECLDFYSALRAGVLSAASKSS